MERMNSKVIKGMNEIKLFIKCFEFLNWNFEKALFSDSEQQEKSCEIIKFFFCLSITPLFESKKSRRKQCQFGVQLEIWFPKIVFVIR